MPGGRFEAISAVATRSAKGKGLNEDRVLLVARPNGGGSAGLVLCDGVGASEGAAEAAERFGEVAAAHMEGSAEGFGIWALPDSVHAANIYNGTGETTLLALGAEESGLVVHLMIGNGSIIELAPAPLPGGGVRLLWSDIALPQIDWREGTPALAGALPAPGAGLCLSKGAQQLTYGSRAFVLCSDGVATLEERAEGADDEGNVWREVPVGLVHIVDSLTALWPGLASIDRNDAAQALQACVDEVLDDLAEEPGIDDDASLGVVFVRRALDEGRVDNG